MSSCEKTELIDSYLGETLEESALAEFEEHLQACSECRDHLAFIKGFRGIVARAEEQKLPEQVRARLTESLDRERSFIKGFQEIVRRAEEQPIPEAVHSRLLKKLEEERAQKVVPLRPTAWRRYLAAAAVICLCALGFSRSFYAPEAPEAVASLVEHHDTCWHIAPSSGREAQYQEWVGKLGGPPPTPAVSSELVAFDQRECPAGEVRAGHMLYHLGEQKVSVYILPSEGFLASYGGELRPHRYDGRQVVLQRQGDWVYGVVAELPAERLRELVDLDQIAALHRLMLARRSSSRG